MTIQVELFDGTPLEFEDGTDPAIIQATVQRLTAEKKAAQQTIEQAPPMQQQAPPVQEQPPAPDLFRERPQSVIPEVMGGLLSEGFAEIASGLAGAVTAPFVGMEEALENMASVKSALTMETRGPIAKEARSFIDKLGAFGVDMGNKSLSGLIALSSLAAGQPLQSSVSQQQSIEDKGFSDFLGESLLQAGAPPAVAAIAKGTPAATLAALGFRIKAGEAPGNVTDTQLLHEKVRKGSEDIDTTELMMEPRQQPTDFEGGNVRPLEAPTQGREGRPSVLPQLEQPKVIKDPLAKEAVKQEFNPSVINSMKLSSPATKAGLLEMTDIKQKGMNNARYEAKNRPSDVVGDSLLERFKVIRHENRVAGSAIDAEAKKLIGEPVDAMAIGDKFIDDLNNDLGVTIDKDLQAVFHDSDIEFSPRAKKAINNVVTKLSRKQVPDAFDLHKIKRFIDEQVTYGKSLTGSLGRTEGVLKKLRTNIDQLLDETFPDYDNVNSIYSETIGVIDELQALAGKKTDLMGAHSAKGLGVLMRRTVSNAQSRTRLLESIDEIERLANKYSGGFADDLLTQILYSLELDNRFGASAVGSFQGQIERAVPRSKADAGYMAVQAGIKKAKGITNEAAFKSIRELLTRPER